MIDEYNGLMITANKETWFDELNKISKRLGFQEVLFGLKVSPQSRLQSAEIISNYKTCWRERYDANQYILIDPMVSRSLGNVTAIPWTASVYTTAAEKAFHEEASHHGYSSGITLPLHGPRGEAGALSFNLGETHQHPACLAHIKSQFAALTLVRDLALSRFLALPGEAPNDPAATIESLNLTARALEILRWSAQGKTSWEISMICGCSEANINFHLGKIRRAFGVNSRKAAIIKAYTLGLIAL